MANIIVSANGQVHIPYLHDVGYRTVDLRLGIQPTEQIFSFVSDKDGAFYHFDIPKIQRMIRAKPSAFERKKYALLPQNVEFLLTHHGIDQGYLKKIDLSRLDDCGLMVEFPDKTELIIDGNHRMVARYRRSHDFMCFYVLTLEQAKPALLDMPQDI